MPGDIRPTQNIVRKAVFDILGQDMSGIKFLELFAGSGSVGLEALSRGAAEVVFVESNSKCVEVLEKNLSLLGLSPEIREEGTEVMEADAIPMIKTLSQEGKKFDIVFLDPPFGLDLAKKALNQLSAYDILHANCIVVVQTQKKEDLPPELGRLRQFKERIYGLSLLRFYQITGQDASEGESA